MFWFFSLYFSPGSAAGNVVGHEWKSLVESSLTGDDKGSAQMNQPGTAASSGVAGSKGPSGDNQDDAAARQPNQDIKIDVLRELQDVAAMTIGETGFFCK